VRKFAIILCVAAIFAVPIFAQDPCAQNTKLSGGQSLSINGNQGMGNLSGTDYHYEIWVNSRPQNAKLTWYGANQGGGGAFKAEWNNNDDYLGRVGFFWGNSGAKWNTHSGLCADFNYSRSGGGGNYSYIGIYGWTLNPSMEWYIIDDWFGNGQLGPATICGNSCSSLGTINVDGGTYNIYTNTRPAGSGCVGCNNQAFPQIFSIRQGMSSGTRKCGTYSITKHFEAWSKISSLSSKIGSNLYDAKFLAEAGGGQGSLDMTYLKMSKTGACYGGTSTGGTTSSSSRANVSSSSRAQVTTCKTPLIDYPPTTVPSDPYTACFKYTNNKCYVCQVENEGEFEGNVNTCASGWVWNGTQIESNITSGYWYYEVPCPNTSSSSVGTTTSSSSRGSSSSTTATTSSSSRGGSSSAGTTTSSSSRGSSSSAGSTPILLNSVPITYFAIQTQSDKALRIEISSPSVVEIFDLKGNKVEKFNVSSTTQTVKLSSPSGVYFARAPGMKSIKFVLK